ncbi:hypothetical protein [Rubinisphaera margarita]|uniref:hypothetical protein n=1 Tax=Rubinisphaera margarita TaxID=2909586 RepID=UPI001EE98AA7|nr:hypothetical protein [Rubinisphaera margarita]MCG6156267.1 hypothetical protein [Rubinisphaera margarita]
MSFIHCWFSGFKAVFSVILSGRESIRRVDNGVPRADGRLAAAVTVHDIIVAAAREPSPRLEKIV